jgi:ferritin
MELKKQISDKTEQLLQERVKGELQSSHIYEAMANWCFCYGFYKASDKYRKYADEERSHMRRLMTYIIDRNGISCVPLAIEEKCEYKSLLDVITKSYEHEVSVTAAYRKIAPVIRNEGDEVTYSELQWFIHEQIEEETKFGDLLILANRLGITDTTTGIELFKLEDELAK